MALTELQYDYRSRKVTWSHPKSMGCPEYKREKERERERERNLQWGTMYCSWNSRATLRNCGGCSRCSRSAGILPLNRVALFAAQITRESLDTRTPVESKATTTIMLRIVPYLGIMRLVSRRFSFSYFFIYLFSFNKIFFFY